MKSKIKYRVFGIIVVVSLVFLTLPFIRQQGKESENKVIAANTLPILEKENIISENETIQATVPKAITAPIPDDNFSMTQKPLVENTQKIAENTFNERRNPSVFSNHKESVAHVKIASAAKKVPSQSPLANKTKLPQQNIKTSSVNKPHIKNNGLFDIKTTVWVVQVGTFDSKIKATKLLNRLKTDGYQAFFQYLNQGRGVKYLVFVGPEMTELAASDLAKQMVKIYHFNSMLARYKPLSI